MTINKFSITKSDYTLIATDSGIDFKLGNGIDMNNPDQPKDRDSPFTPKISIKGTTVSTTELRQSSIEYIESSKIEDYYQALSVNIKASYGLSSLSANYNRVVTEQKNYFMVIVLITDSLTNEVSLDDKKFITTPVSENMQEDDDSKAYQFLQDFGSHYISKITFGYQIAFEAKVDKSQFTDETHFSASLNAAYGAFSGGGGIDMTTINALKTKGVSISGRIICGGIVPDRPLVINSVDDLTTFMQSLSSGDKTINRGPLKIFLRSYFSTLVDYPKTRKLFTPDFKNSIKSDFGVPAGTIIAYYPQININNSDLLIENEYYWLPDGWSICNGTNDTPNLIDRFIMGSDAKQFGNSGGRVEHTHGFINAGYDTMPDDSGNSSGCVATVENHLPPFFKLIYIMKK